MQRGPPRLPKSSPVSGSELARLRLEVQGVDADEALAALSGLYAGREWWAGGAAAAFTYRYAALGDEQMTLRTARVTGTMHGGVPPGDDLVVQWLLSGRGTVDVGRDSVRLETGRPYLFGAHESFVFDYHDYDQKIVHLDRGLVTRAAVDRGQVQEGQQVRFERRERPSDSATALWLDTVGLVSRTLQRGRVNDLLWSELRRMTAGAFLELYTPSAVVPEEAGGLRSARVRVALEFVHEHAAQPITPGDVARAAGVSVRALQTAFQQSLGESPAAVIRRVRLDRAHADLRSADPQRTTVAAVAREWGFVHLGRFAAQYRERFGVPPGETLRR